MIDDVAGLRRVLMQNRTIAVVGLSANWYRPSYFAAKYMLDHGYTVIPVNPAYAEVLGQKCYPSLRDVPQQVDMVDFFRRAVELQQRDIENDKASRKPIGRGQGARRRRYLGYRQVEQHRNRPIGPARTARINVHLL